VQLKMFDGVLAWGVSGKLRWVSAASLLNRRAAAPLYFSPG
jgi:hypothetical protein